MRIVFLGYAVHPDINQGLSGHSVAGNKMELSILRELKKNGFMIDSITVYPIAAFPKDKTLIVNRKKMDIGGGIHTDRVGFFNIPGIKQITQICAVYRSAKKIISENPQTVVVPFNMYPQVGIPAVMLKRKFGSRVVPILADLPIDDNYQRKGVNKIIHKYFNNTTKRCIEKVDEVIVLNKNAREQYAPRKKYIVVDGGIDISPPEENDSTVYWEDDKKHILYTGSLQEYSGITEMIRAMQYVENPQIVLDIYGAGSLEKRISSLKKDNVFFHGTVDNQTVMDLQRSSWLLVNPRPVNDEIAKVTFPSKIFEYMLSGTPILATRLNGFTSEYDDKLLFVEDNDPKLLAEAVNNIDKMDVTELRLMARRAQKFIVNKRTWEYQVKRIADFLKNGENK